MNKGFTLIELLVVVLIIGILAAIALPQYQKAVERSRMAEAMQVLGDWATAQSTYYMQHNEFAREWGEGLGDVTLADPSAEGKWSFRQSGSANETTMTASRDGGMYSGAALQITVRNDGSLLKECLPNGHDAFCTSAETAGYRLAAVEEAEDAPTPDVEEDVMAYEEEAEEAWEEEYDDEV